MDGEVVKVVGNRLSVVGGSAGLATQVPGGIASVSNLTNATDGVIERHTD